METFFLSSEDPFEERHESTVVTHCCLARDALAATVQPLHGGPAEVFNATSIGGAKRGLDGQADGCDVSYHTVPAVVVCCSIVVVVSRSLSSPT